MSAALFADSTIVGLSDEAPLGEETAWTSLAVAAFDVVRGAFGSALLFDALLRAAERDRALADSALVNPAPATPPRTDSAASAPEVASDGMPGKDAACPSLPRAAATFGVSACSS